MAGSSVDWGRSKEEKAIERGDCLGKSTAWRRLLPRPKGVLEKTERKGLDESRRPGLGGRTFEAVGQDHRAYSWGTPFWRAAEEKEDFKVKRRTRGKGGGGVLEAS